MASSRMANKILQALYRPHKSKSPSIMLKDLEAMEKALESATVGIKGKKDKEKEE